MFMIKIRRPPEWYSAGYFYDLDASDVMKIFCQKTWFEKGNFSHAKSSLFCRWSLKLWEAWKSWHVYLSRGYKLCELVRVMLLQVFCPKVLGRVNIDFGCPIVKVLSVAKMSLWCCGWSETKVGRGSDEFNFGSSDYSCRESSNLR